MYEMMSYETDHQRHLRGCSSLFTHNRTNIGYRELKRTAFWTYFREEISVALSNMKPTNIHPSQWKVDITWSGDTDYVKTEKMTLLAAEVVDYCFGPAEKHNTGAWEGLQHDVELWEQSLPESFQPLYMIKDSGPFPEIAYLCTWHSKLNFGTFIRVFVNPPPSRCDAVLPFNKSTSCPSQPTPRERHALSTVCKGSGGTNTSTYYSTVRHD
jgi:hypothetical protein